MLLKLAAHLDPETAVMRAVREENPRYNNNIRVDSRNLPTTKRHSACRFTLRAIDSSDLGARKAASGRKGTGVTWEAHRDIMQRIFDAHPDAILVTALTTYRGKEDFEHRHADTFNSNAGSANHPVAFGSL